MKICPTYPLTPMKIGVQSPNRGLWNAKHWFPTFVGMSGIVLVGCSDNGSEAEIFANRNDVNIDEERVQLKPKSGQNCFLSRTLVNGENFGFAEGMLATDAKEILEEKGFQYQRNEHDLHPNKARHKCLTGTQLPIYRNFKIENGISIYYLIGPTFKDIKKSGECVQILSVVPKISITKAKPC